uniref:Uncharacterized protein n=1 Tax=Plectus sambesii TaxID=2011161 RepID=A0A914XEP5_9BILA
MYLIAGFLTFINCYNVKWATRTQDVFTIAKVLALVIIIISGIVWLVLGHTEHFEMPDVMENSKTDPGHISLAFYSGVFSFAGWNYLNFVTEELKEPHKNLPRAIYISMPTVTVIYLLVNVAYFAVLSPDELLESNAVAVSFADRVLGPVAFLMPLFVAFSCVGSLNGTLFASSRMFFVGARDGQLPELLSMINLRYVTPMPSLLFLGGLSCVMLISSDIIALINYTTFAESAVVAVAVAGLLYLRYTRPNLERPIKLNLLIPISFFVMCMFLVVFPFFVSPDEVLVGLLMIISGFPVYFLFVYWQSKPKAIVEPWVRLTHSIQKLLWCVPGEGEAKDV